MLWKSSPRSPSKTISEDSRILLRVMEGVDVNMPWSGVYRELGEAE